MTKFPPYIFHFSEALTGDYKGVDHSGAWEKMINYCEKENRAGCIDAEYISVYLDDPMTTPAEKGGHDVVSSRSDARRGSQQDNEGGAEREHIHIFIRRFAVGREEVVVQEKSHSVRGIDLEGQRHAGAEGETSG